MAGKNEVKLTFAGDAKSLERATGSAEQAMAGVGSASRELEADLDRSSGGLRRLDKVVGDGGRRFGDYGTGLGGLGDRADEVDTRMMGLSDGIQGVSDLMRANELRPHEFAMAFSDLGSAMYNTVVPSLQAGAKGLKNMIGQLGGVKGAAITAGGVLGAAGLALAINEMEQAAERAQIDEFALKLRATGDAGATVSEIFNGNWKDLAQFGAVLADLVSNGDYDLAAELIDQAEAGGLAAGAADTLRERLGLHAAAAGEATTAQGRFNDEVAAAVEGIQEFADALQAQFDPLFGATDAARDHADAQAAVAEAQAAVNDAIAEYGEGSPEHLAAVQGLTAANAEAVRATADLTTAQAALAQGIANGDVKLEDAQAQLAAWVAQGLITEQQANEMAWAFGVAASQADTLATDRGFNIWASDGVSGTVDHINRKLAELQDKTITIRQNVVTTGPGGSGGIPLAGGGIVPQYLASGGVGGPRGTDTVPAWLTPGEMVLNKSQQLAMFRALDAGAAGRPAAGAGTTVNVYVQGSIRSDRDLVKVIGDAVSRGDLVGVSR